MFTFDNTYARELEGTFVPWTPARPQRPTLVVLNEALADELGLDVEALRAAAPSVLSGASVPDGATPLAQAYAGHQFGGLSPQLGDGRALLLGELVDRRGRRRDLQLKGSGRTPFSRGGDGKAALGPMLREYVIGEALHALGVPTSRALAVTRTGEPVHRERALPGAVLARIAASHLRVGTLEFFAIRDDVARLRLVVDYALRRHHPDAAGVTPALALLTAVRDAQAQLVAAWLGVGFIHGVMNTDNVTLSGESLDFGPCAFLDAHDPDAVFSSIDDGGRYAYDNQPRIMAWNLARMASALLPVIDPAEDRAIALAQEVLAGWPEVWARARDEVRRAKLGLDEVREGDEALVADWWTLLAGQQPDHTLAFRHLATAARGDPAPLRALFADPAPIDAWLARWRSRVDPGAPDRMDTVNPRLIPRNHRVEEALAAATEGDLAPLHRLVDAVRRPFDATGHDALATPAPASFTATYQTFCGT